MHDFSIVIPTIAAIGLLCEYAARKLQISIIRMAGPIFLTLFFGVIPGGMIVLLVLADETTVFPHLDSLL